MEHMLSIWLKRPGFICWFWQLCGFPLFKCSFPTVGFYMFFLGMFGSPWFKQTAQLVDVLHFSGPNKNWRPRMSSSRCATVMAAASRKPCTASLVCGLWRWAPHLLDEGCEPYQPQLREEHRWWATSRCSAEWDRNITRKIPCFMSDDYWKNCGGPKRDLLDLWISSGQKYV